MLIPLIKKKPTEPAEVQQESQPVQAGAPIKANLSQKKPARKSSAKKEKIIVDPTTELRATIERIFANEDAVLITTEAELKDFLSLSDVFGLDTETTGLRFFADRIVGFSLGTATKSCYIPLTHEAGQNYQDDLDRMCDLLLTKKYYGFNAQFDWHFLEHFKPQLKNLQLAGEGSVALRCYDITLPHELKPVYKKVIDPDYEEYSFSRLFKSIKFHECDPKFVYKYAAVDARKHFVVTEYFEEKLKEVPEMYTRYRKLELRALWPLYDTEEYGMCVDVDRINMLWQRLEDQKAPALAEIQRIAGSDTFNPGSPKQVKEVFAALGYQLTSTNEEALEKINHPLAKAILEYRGIIKLQGTYTKNLLEYTDVREGSTIIHTSFNSIGADCVVGDTLITTREGMKKIADVCPKGDSGEYIPFETELLNEEGRFEKTSRSVIFRQAKTKKLNLPYGLSIEGTYNHPVRVLGFNKSEWEHKRTAEISRVAYSNVQWRELQDIEVGDYVLLKTGGADIRDDYIETGFVQLPEKKSSQQLVMPKYYTEELAELLGMFHADGAYNDKDHVALLFYNSDPDFVARLNELTMKVFGVTPKVERERREGFPTDTYFLHGANLRQLFAILHTGKRNKRIPEPILRSKNSVFAAYVRGMTLDSGYRGDCYLHITCMNEDDAKNIAARLIHMGIVAGTYHEANNKDGSDAWGVTVYEIDSFMKKVGVVQSRKVTAPIEGKLERYFLRRGDYFAVPVRSLEYNVTDVYDFTLPETHSFMTNGGIVSHNTGRMSSKNPNMQNIPRDNDYRNIFVARPGKKLISVDYSQQEVRVVAAMANDQTMLDAFNSGRDFYAYMASLVFKLPYEECGKHGVNGAKRNQMKSVVLGLNYSMGIQSLAEDLGTTEAEAKDIMEKFYEACPNVHAFQAQCLEFAKTHGYNETYFGHRRYYKGLGYKALGLPRFEVFGPGLENGPRTPDEIQETLYQLKNRRRELRAFIEELKAPAKKKDTANLAVYVNDREMLAFQEERQTTNSVIQGTSAEMTKLAAIAVRDDEELRSLDAHIVNFIHDEIIIEAPEETASRAGERLAFIMNDVCHSMFPAIASGGAVADEMVRWTKD